jgi:hypothetical protein
MKKVSSAVMITSSTATMTWVLRSLPLSTSRTTTWSPLVTRIMGDNMAYLSSVSASMLLRATHDRRAHQKHSAASVNLFVTDHFKTSQ